jgi:hypothetical protein
MCIGPINPLTIAGIAASAGGAALNARMQNQAITEQNRQNQMALARERTARDAEVARQRAFELGQADLVTRALADAAPQQVQEQATQAAADPTNPVTLAQSEYNVPTLSGQIENQDVSEVVGRTLSDAAQRTRQMLTAAAIMGGQDRALTGANFGLGRMGSELQTIGSNRAGSMGASRLETSVPAATVTRSTSPIGDLLMLGGMALSGQAGQGLGAARAGGQPLTAIPWMNRG